MQRVSLPSRLLGFGALLLVVAMLVVLLLASSSRPAYANIFTVNTESDLVDSNPGDGACDVLGFGVCSLRAAVMEANALEGDDLMQNPTPSAPYVVPADNPFVGQDGVRPEIWAYGVRNPWRMSFDAETGRLWLGDVGQSRFEEIDIVERGANLGWNLVEGGSCFQGDCDLANFAAPVAVYDHDLGCSVTGGVVARRSGLSYLDGAYVYGDFCSGRVWTIDADLPAEPIEILTSPRPISSFAEARDGTVYALTFGGAILRFAAAE